METYALTTGAYHNVALFVRADLANLLVSTLFKYRNKGKYQLHGFVIMPEHIHVLLTPLEDQTIEKCAQLIKGGFSHDAWLFFKGDIWRPGFHEHRIRDSEDFHAQLQYIANNPSKRHLHDYAYVHTKFASMLDPIPSRFR
jgi:putative transposase